MEREIGSVRLDYRFGGLVITIDPSDPHTSCESAHLTLNQIAELRDFLNIIAPTTPATTEPNG